MEHIELFFKSVFIDNMVFATFLGIIPQIFLAVSIGSGIEKVIDQNAELKISTIIFSPEIYVPITAFLIILSIAFVVRKFYFKQ